ncbi:hypothetical protein ACJMK2_022696 [Sinanodonta woodiana]|uniref:Uncharacterized protein n=1 Tax=Sinanodonta woodiana TaxID=1069815 RepID=A0ABD3TL48_SINWO
MSFFGTTVVILLVIIVDDVRSHCPKSGCDCGEFCVNINNRWCNSTNDEDCSCVKGCLVFDRLMKPGESDTIYCGKCFCSALLQEGEALCIGQSYCVPANLTVNNDYPASGLQSPNCKTSIEDYYEDITTGIMFYYIILYYIT